MLATAALHFIVLKYRDFAYQNNKESFDSLISSLATGLGREQSTTGINCKLLARIDRQIQ